MKLNFDFLAGYAFGLLLAWLLFWAGVSPFR